MPIYEYRCKSCQQSFETLRGFSQKDELTPCPMCGTPTKTRLLSLTAATSHGESCGWDAGANACVRPG
jgi:putative FmdB family regulatory protein